MSALIQERRRLWLVGLVLVAFLLAAQALASYSAPPGGRASTGRVLGKTGFAYLGGLRTFAAAALWNRIEPQFHGYYSGIPIEEQVYMIPTLRLVVALDPQFSQAYYISTWILYSHSPTEGVALARQATADNPKSGILQANLAQLLFIEDKAANRQEILSHITAGLASDDVWLDDAQRYEGLASMAQTLDGLGEKQAAATVQGRLATMRESGANLGDHDHDGDGKQDH